MKKGKSFELRFISIGLTMAAVLLSSCGTDQSVPKGSPSNQPPVADAGIDQAVIEGATVTLTGTGTDAETPSELLDFMWEQVIQNNEPTVTLTNADTHTASFTAPAVTADTTLTFRLTVTDADNASDTDEMTVVVSEVPDGAALFSIADASVTEGNSGTVNLNFTVTRSGETATAVSVRATTSDGTATAPADYASKVETIDFASYETTQIFTVVVNGDTQFETDETLTVTLDNAGEGNTLSKAAAIGTITNDEPFICPAGTLCVGAAKRPVAPSDKHIAGVLEAPRLSASEDGSVGEKVQKFGLGGWGLSDLGASLASTNPHIGNGFATGNYAQPEGTGTKTQAHSTYVRAMVVEKVAEGDLEGGLVVFVTLDAVGAGNIIQKNLKAAVTAATGIPADNILFGQTHSHSAADLQGLWGGVPATWLDCDASKVGQDGCGVEDNWNKGLYQLAAEAVKEALNNRKAAKLTVATGTVNRNNTRTSQVTPDQTTDKAMTVLRASRDDNTIIGTILQYAAHPTIVGDSNRLVHSDYVVSTLIDLEKDGGTALYYNGTIADTEPGGRDSSQNCSGTDSPNSHYCEARNFGKALAAEALTLLGNPAVAKSVENDLTVSHTTSMLPVTNPLFLGAGLARMFNGYYNFVEMPVDDVAEVALVRKELPQVAPFATTTVSRITLGNPKTGNGLEIATIPGEARNSLGQLIRLLAQNDNDSNTPVPVMLLGLTHNSFGYIVPEQEFAGGPQDLLYEEIVSLGPLTAPLLRVQSYYPLFNAPPEAYVPEYLSSCSEAVDSNACIVEILRYRLVGGGTLDGIREGLETLADGCRDEIPAPFDALCAIPDGLLVVYDLITGGGGELPGGGDTALLAAAADAQVRGCDILDPSHCLFPFPSDHFTVAAAPDSPQARNEANSKLDGTGRRINFNPLAMPRNVAGKPIDPTEWNRNDGFSPGQMIVTYVPGLAAFADGTIPGAPTIKDASTSLDIVNSPVLVLDAETGKPHPVWAEIDLNAGKLLVNGGDAGGDSVATPNPKPKQPALIIRPAINFKEGHRYVVVLRNLKNGAGETIPAGPAFTACRDDLDTALPPLQQRCEALEEGVFDALPSGVARNNLYLAWDFTVASARNNVGRLRHMRDDAFMDYLGQQEDEDGNIENMGRAPAFQITEVNENPANHIVREIKGTFTVPSYVQPVDPSPLDGQAEFRRRLNGLPPAIQSQLESGPLFAPIEVSSPPNRLFYNPADGLNPNDPAGSRFGDGLPDRTGEMTTTFTCRIAKSTLSGKRFPGEGVPAEQVATAANVKPARASLYGHGLLGDHGEINQDQLRNFGNDHNMMFCATDWFGFASGDLPNVLSFTLDLSNFPSLPDGTQQGILNQLFLARLMRHPQGFAANENFRVGDTPVFDAREVFYDGNSQGGITGGVVVAVSKDIKRGSLGVLGMNYSTLLTRSVDFDTFSVPLYLSYPDDLDRNLNFSLMQMLWDRSENNGYAHHLRDNSALSTQDKTVLLHPAFGDHQVTMWSADVMARTIGATVDRTRVASERRGPVGFNNPELPGFETTDYLNPVHASGSGLMYWDQPWPDTEWQDCAGMTTAVPPIGNVSPRLGNDPHECPRRQAAARCQKSHFLHRQSRLIDVSGVNGPADCPAELDPVGIAPPAGPGTGSIVRLCLPGVSGACIDVASIPVIGALLADALNSADGVTEAVADSCHDNAGPLGPGCVITDGVAQIVQQGSVSGADTASCAAPGRNLTRGSHYQVTLTSASNETISFEVFEPTKTGGIQCTAGAGTPGAHPLILHGHGFGGSREKDDTDFADYRNAGYTVISIDQRGFGQSTGTVRTMDPDFEGKDLVQILDWAETNLDYLAYRNEGTGLFVARPAGGASTPAGANLLVGAIGSSYGGGFQFLLHNVDEKNRLDALAPDITWHDLRYSLNPGDTLKSAFGLLLTAGGERGSYSPAVPSQSNPTHVEDPTHRGIDPYIKEVLARAVVTGEFPRESLAWFRYHSPTYWCGLPQPNEPTRPYDFAEWDVDPNTMLGTLAGDVPGSNDYSGQPPVDVLLSQGFRDNLFNFNEAWWNYQCARVRATGPAGEQLADVRLITHQSGHILNLGGLTGQPVPPGTPLDVQVDNRNQNCGAIVRTQNDALGGSATLQWFNEKLRGVNATRLDVTDDRKLCLSLSENDAVFVPEENVLAPRATAAGFPAAAVGTDYYQTGVVGAASVPQGVLALALHNAGQLSPSVVPLLSVGDANGLIVAGIPQATFTVKTPAGVNDAACAAAPSQLPSLRTGCDSIIYVGLGKKSGDSSWVLIDDQITPVRGLGKHTDFEMVGVAERLANGDQLALLIYGYHPQYIASYSRDVSIPVVNVTADLKLPLYAVHETGKPNFQDDPGVMPVASGDPCTNPDAMSVTPECFATGNATNVVRQLCDYQWLPGVCEMFAHGATGYTADGYNDTSDTGKLIQLVGAVHEHSGYSDGDPTAIPRDYFNSAKSGTNLKDGCTVNTDTGCNTGIKLDFMFSSEHSDNEKLPITTAAVCAQPLVDGAEALADSFGDRSPTPFTDYLMGFGPDSPTTALTAVLSCNNALTGDHHYFKWAATLEQAMQATDSRGAGERLEYNGFTGVRGFEWTNDYYNHLNVYFSTNVVNVKVDGSYASMDFFWNWLRKPVAKGGGADALVTFNHPGGNPSLSPFDGSAPTGDLLDAARPGTSNWNDLAYVDAGIDERVVGMEVNGGDDIEWYVKALTKGWHIGPVANEDEHQREWSTSNDGKTLILTRGRSPRDYYYAFQNRRTVAIHNALVDGIPGEWAEVPTIHYWADGDYVQNSAPLGSIITAEGEHTLQLEMHGLPADTRVALISNTGGGQANPIALVDTDDSSTAFAAKHFVTTPASGQNWYFAVLCPSSAGADCGKDLNYFGVTAPIWFGAGAVAPPAAAADYGPGILGAFAQFFAELNNALVALVSGDAEGTGDAFMTAFVNFSENLSGIPDEADPENLGTTVVGLDQEPDAYAMRAGSAARDVEPVVMTGDKLPGWSQPAASGVAQNHFSGFENFSGATEPGFGPRNAHAGVFMYPPNWVPGDEAVNRGGAPVNEIAAWAYRNGGWEEIPVQVDERYPYFLANGNSTFSFYSGIDQELSYAWDTESWGMTKGVCNKEYDPAGIDVDRPGIYTPLIPDADPNQGVSKAIPDPVAGLDDDDEVVFMASDAGSMAPPAEIPPGATAVQLITLADPTLANGDADAIQNKRFVYLVRQPSGSFFNKTNGYVKYERHANADQWIDRSFFAAAGRKMIGSIATISAPATPITAPIWMVRCVPTVRIHLQHASPRLMAASPTTIPPMIPPMAIDSRGMAWWSAPISTAGKPPVAGWCATSESKARVTALPRTRTIPTRTTGILVLI